MDQLTPVTHEQAREAAGDDPVLSRYVLEQSQRPLLGEPYSQAERDLAKEALIRENPRDLGPYDQHRWDYEQQRNYIVQVMRVPSDENIEKRALENRKKMLKHLTHRYQPVPVPKGDVTALYDGIIMEMRKYYEREKPLKWWQRRRYSEGSWWGDDNLMIELYRIAISKAKESGFI